LFPHQPGNRPCLFIFLQQMLDDPFPADSGVILTQLPFPLQLLNEDPKADDPL